VFADGNTPYHISDEIKIYRPAGLHGLTLRKTEHIYLQTTGYHIPHDSISTYRLHISHSTRQYIYIETTVYHIPQDSISTYRLQYITFHTTVYLPREYSISHSTRQCIYLQTTVYLIPHDSVSTYRLQYITFHKTVYLPRDTSMSHSIRQSQSHCRYKISRPLVALLISCGTSQYFTGTSQYFKPLNCSSKRPSGCTFE
jgi:hypothetical protein